MRARAGAVARQAADRDYAKAKKALDNLTVNCNRCHQTFRVPVTIAPEKDKGELDTE